ncbi:MAG: N-acetylmuramoyl-L-alanine amidase [Clostridia bacterium]|nr:N-acetylmuramoyl-L-alanine amidase [Clostridia bacterium]
MKKSVFICLVSFLCIVLVSIILFGICFVVPIYKNTESKQIVSALPTIVIDCGHGGPDGGAVGADGTCEKDINLALGFALREILIQNGYQVVMTREKDAFICDDHSASLREQNVSDIHNRLKIAKSVPNSLFISIHMNNFSDTRYWGSQLFYGPKNKQSITMSEAIQKRLVTTVQKGNDRPLKQMDSSVYIIYNAPMPALLLECGFMSNTAELNRFKNTQYRCSFAFSVFLGINDYIKGVKHV